MPPNTVIANGSLALTLDPEGNQRLTPGHDDNQPGIWRRGRRLDRKTDRLLDLGRFHLALQREDRCLNQPIEAKQTLNTATAIVTGTAHYDQDITLKTTSFVVQHAPIIALQRTIHNRGEELAHVTATFAYNLTRGNTPFPEPPEGMTIQQENTGVSCGSFHYSAETTRPSDGCVCLKTTNPNIKATTRDHTLKLTFFLLIPPKTDKTLTFFIFFADQQDDEHYTKLAFQTKNKLRVNSFQTLLEEHREYWRHFWKRVDLILPNQDLTRSYRTALYHLKTCAAQDLGFPDAIARGTSQARINGLHELFIVTALLATGFPELAQLPTGFRKQELPLAMLSASGEPPAACFPLQADEDGLPAGPQETWPGTICQNAHIALAAWHNARFQRNRDLLIQDAYPILKAVANFFFNLVTECPQEDVAALCPCRDFPASGPPGALPLATTCAVISTLDATTQAALLLDRDPDSRVRWSATARKLKANLPHNGNQLTTNQRRNRKSLALLAGIYPYQVTDLKDRRQKRALATLFKHMNAIPAPDGTPQPSPWTFAWLAATAACLELPVLAEDALLEAVRLAGPSGELPEHSGQPDDTPQQPWFTPAEATFAHALALMLLQSDTQTIRLLPATPETWQDLDFTLPACGGLEVKVKIRSLTVTRLTVHNKTDAPAARMIFLPPHLKLPHPLTATHTYGIPPRNTLRII